MPALGYVFDSGSSCNLDAFNLLNTAGEPDRLLLHLAPARRAAAGVNDLHFHPVEPLAFRLTLAKAF